MSSPSPHSPVPTSLQRSRQKVVLIALGTVLMLGGFVVLFALKRMPLPLRLMVGLGDLIAASALFMILRQKFSGSSGRP